MLISWRRPTQKSSRPICSPLKSFSEEVSLQNKTFQKPKGSFLLFIYYLLLWILFSSFCKANISWLFRLWRRLWLWLLMLQMPTATSYGCSIYVCPLFTKHTKKRILAIRANKWRSLLLDDKAPVWLFFSSFLLLKWPMARSWKGHQSRSSRKRRPSSCKAKRWNRPTKRSSTSTLALFRTSLQVQPPTRALSVSLHCATRLSSHACDRQKY